MRRQLGWLLLLLGILGSVQAAEVCEDPGAPTGDPLFVSETFAGSGNCVWCHNNIHDQQGNDVSIGTDWSSTMMANASRDPFWRAKVRHEDCPDRFEHTDGDPERHAHRQAGLHRW